MAPVLLRDWFALKPDRDNFKPHNIRDSRLIFCHSNIVTTEVLGSIEQRFAANEPVKMLIFGDWGVGKTHTIHHVRWWFQQNAHDYPVTSLVIEIGDIAKNSRFDAIVGPFIDNLGMDALVSLVFGYLQHHPNIVQGLQAAGVPLHIATAFSKLLLSPPGQTPPPLAAAAVEYLKGRRLSGEASKMGFGAALTDSGDFFHVLNAIATMHLTVHGHRLLFIADEAAKLEAIDADDSSRAHWVNVNKLIFDDNNTSFGFIYTISARRRTLPVALFESQLQNRLGDRLCELKNLDPVDVGQFLRGLIDEFVDRPTVENRVQAGDIPASEFVWDDYPFTSAAKVEFIDYFSRSQENAKPRDISNKLNDVAFVAAKSNKRLIDTECLQQAKM